VRPVWPDDYFSGTFAVRHANQRWQNCRLEVAGIS
jgi:hypothetical protein